MTVTEAKERKSRLIEDARAIDAGAGGGGLSVKDAVRFNAIMAEVDELQKVIGGNLRGAEYTHAFWRVMQRQSLTSDESRALTVGTDTGGGYVAPGEFDASVREGRDETSTPRQWATISPNTRHGRTIPVCESAGSAEWGVEGEAYVESDSTFAVRTFRGDRHLGRVVKVSQELAEDGGPAFEAALRRAIVRSFAAGEEKFVDGDGVKTPRGVLIDATAGGTAAGTTTITPTELRTFAGTLPAAYRSNARWLVHYDTLVALSLLVGTDGQNQNIVIWQNGKPYILGDQAYTSGNMPQMVAGAAAFVYGDLSYYHVVERTELVIQTVRELYSVEGMVGYIVRQHMDGRLVIPESCVKLTMHS
jgi:HK97 family phage major capsid protein